MGFRAAVLGFLHALRVVPAGVGPDSQQGAPGP